MKTSLAHLVRGKISASGAALIMTVIILAMITIMVLGLADLVRYETVSSSAHQERARAQLFARMGVDIVTGVLRKETADPAKTWASKPGALIVPNPDASPPQLTRLNKQVNLHSGLPSPALLDPVFQPNVLRPANLNIETFADQNPPTHLITDQPQNPANPASPVVQLPIRWIYVRADGTLDYTETPDLTRRDNPLVGRFAYWTDDESSKINLNTAWKRNGAGSNGVTNTFPPGHQTSINLASISGLTPQMADDLHALITPNHAYTDLDDSLKPGRFFNSPREVRVLGAEFTAVFNAAKFEVTHYNHDPDTTFFNEPRIVLTTQKMYARGRPFLDILTNPGTDTALGADPGTVGNISASKLNTIIMGDAKAKPAKLGLVDYLKREDWPMVSGKSSFQQKYYPTTNSAERTIRLTQIALNIIDYVRSAESTLTLVEPIRGIINSSNKFVCDAHDSSIRGLENTYKGLTRNLYVTEMGVWVKKNPEAGGAHKGRYENKFYVELHLPRNYGVPSLDLLDVGGKKIYVYINPVVVLSNTKSTGDAQAPGYFSKDNVAMNGRWFRINKENVVGDDTVLKEGEYKTLIFPAYRYDKSGRMKNINMRTAIILADDAGTTPKDPATFRLEVTPVGDPSKTEDLVYTVDGGDVPEAEITSFQSDDPRVNAVPRDFSAKGQPRNTFGAANAVSILAVPRAGDFITVPQQDTDSAGFLTDAGMYMPYPKGHPRNPRGMVLSPGELGHIHTGIEVTSSAPKGGVPWRTLRLQPNRQTANDVPDWAFMDLFTVPVDVPPLARGVFAPHDTTTAGRVNMNSQAQPFGNPTLTSTPLERRLPLVALLTGVTKNASGAQLNSKEAQTIARNIYFRTLSPKKGDPAIQAGKVYGHESTYDSPGEVVEIEGVADGGEESEAVVRGIANLICARGSVFNVYTIGQSLKQTRNGELQVTAEQRQQTLIERYDRNTNPNTTEIYFRKASFQHLNP